MSRKKEASAEALNEARNELQSLRSELTEKQTQLRESDGQDMLKGEDVSERCPTYYIDAIALIGSLCLIFLKGGPLSALMVLYCTHKNNCD